MLLAILNWLLLAFLAICNAAWIRMMLVTVFMYLDEAPVGQTRDDLALIIEETLLQRIEGVKNEKGVWITPAFPKLIYVLDENNMDPDSKYYHLTELAAKCTAKRMVPDYISAKVMKQLKGDVYACMGCRSFLTPSDEHKYYGDGVRVSLFVSGCRNRCKGCHNPEAWDFGYGQPFTKETED